MQGRLSVGLEKSQKLCRKYLSNEGEYNGTRIGQCDCTVYNVEEYLVDCIESIRNQIYSKLEIILVDDGSPDNCGAICDEYARKDSRIRVIHKTNGGLSDARNVV